jgi:hypothetical protein
VEFPILTDGKRERKRKGGKLPFWREKNKNFLDPQSILLEPSESFNIGPSDLFPSHICGASKWLGTLSYESTIPLRPVSSTAAREFS